MKNFWKGHSARIVNLTMLFVVIWTVSNLKYHKLDRVIEMDVKSYYSYLPAAFINNDLELRFMDENWNYWHNWFWPVVNEEGQYVIKTSMGMAYLYSPFFFAGHIFASAVGEATNGYTWPYRLALSVSSILFLSIGLYYLRSTLLRHFSQAIVTLSCLAILFGTNLIFYSTIQLAYSHVYSFALIAMFIYFLEPWLAKPGWKHTILLGVLIGLISLIRPTNVVVVLLFLLYGVATVSALGARIKMLWQRKIAVIAMIALLLLVWAPQFAYWKFVTGDWLYFSYGEERFFFNNPQLWKGLFSYQKGWLLYTPMMLFALLGIVLSWRHKREWTWALALFVAVNIYVIFSWWCWWYGGSFGQRAFVDFYAILALPLGLMLTWMRERQRWMRIAFYTVFTFFICLNLFQAKQIYGGKELHYDAMTKEAYWATFLSLDRPANWEELLAHPDYEAAMEGKYIYYKGTASE